MEGLIHEETAALVSLLDRHVASGQEEMDLLPFLPITVINVLWAIMAGKRHDYDDTGFSRLTKAVVAIFRDGRPLDPLLLFPALQKVPIINATHQRQLKESRKIQDYIEVSFRPGCQYTHSVVL